MVFLLNFVVYLSLQIVDMEFAGIGLRAYDIALILEKILFHIFCQFRHGNHDRVKTLHKALHLAVDTYSHEVKTGLNSNATEPGFVEQVCGLMGCEQMWRSVISSGHHS